MQMEKTYRMRMMKAPKKKISRVREKSREPEERIT